MIKTSKTKIRTLVEQQIEQQQQTERNNIEVTGMITMTVIDMADMVEDMTMIETTILTLTDMIDMIGMIDMIDMIDLEIEITTDMNRIDTEGITITTDHTEDMTMAENLFMKMGSPFSILENIKVKA